MLLKNWINCFIIVRCYQLKHTHRRYIYKQRYGEASVDNPTFCWEKKKGCKNNKKRKNKMVSLSVMTVINHPAALHMKLHCPVRRDMTAVAVLTKHSEKAVSTSSDEHWNYCHEMLPKVSKSFGSLVLQIAQPQLRDAVNLYHIHVIWFCNN